MGRAAERGRHHRIGADGKCRGGGPADARRWGARRWAPRRDPRQCPVPGTRILYRSEGSRVSDGSLLTLDLAAARDGLVRRKFSARELAAAYNDAVAEPA